MNNFYAIFDFFLFFFIFAESLENSFREIEIFAL